MDLKLDGRAFFVTGISRGIGRCIAQALLDEGALVAGCARGASGLAKLQTALPSQQRDRLLVFAADVTDGPGLANAVAEASAAFGRLDGLVANAGAGVSGGVLETPSVVWDEQLHLKVQSVLNLVRPALAGLRASDAARIVVLNGVTAHAPEPGMAAVSAARAAVANLTTSLALELSADGILVNAVNLGAIATGRQQVRYRDCGTSLPFDDWAAEEADRRGIVLGRFGLPAEVVPPVLLLLSPLSSYITGTCIDVAGGSGIHA